MNIEKIGKEIIKAFNIGHVSAASEAIKEYGFYKVGLKEYLQGKIPSIF